MSTAHVLQLALASAIFGSGLGLAVTRIEARWPDPHRYGRKLAHLGVFSGAAAVHLWSGFWGVVIYGLMLSLLLFAARIACPRGGPWAALQKTPSPSEFDPDVLVPYIATVLGGASTSLLLGDLAVVGYLVCGWGDPTGAWLGRRAGRRRVLPPFRPREGGQKTLVGSLGVLCMGALGALVALLAVGTSPGQALWMGLVSGCAGALAEAAAPSTIDNFWLQVVPAFLAWWVLG